MALGGLEWASPKAFPREKADTMQQLVKRSDEQLTQAVAQVERQGQLLSPERIEAAIAQKTMIKQAIAKVLEPGEDYGQVPGCGDEPILLKPGLEKICNLLNVFPDPEVTRREMEGGHLEVTVKTRLKQIGSDVTVAVGHGSCSTMEKKYRYRLAQFACPECEEEALVKTSRNQWWCTPKKGGCGANFALNDERIDEQERGYVENPDISDARNTALKMALKRAHKSAVDNLTGGWSAAIRHLGKAAGVARASAQGSASSGKAGAAAGSKPAPGGQTKVAAILASVSKWPADDQNRFDELVMSGRQSGLTEEAAIVRAMEGWKK